MDYHCVSVGQRTARYLFVLYSALFLCTFSVFHCGNLCFSMLYFFHIALFLCCTFSILHHFYDALFCVVIFFMSFYVSAVKSISTRHKIPCRYFNYDIEHEWTLKKLVSALLFSTLLSHNYRPKRGRTFC